MKAAGKIKYNVNLCSIKEQRFRGKISTKRSSGKKNLKSPGILNKFTISS